MIVAKGILGRRAGDLDSDTVPTEYLLTLLKSIKSLTRYSMYGNADGEKVWLEIVIWMFPSSTMSFLASSALVSILYDLAWDGCSLASY